MAVSGLIFTCQFWSKPPWLCVRVRVRVRVWVCVGVCWVLDMLKAIYGACPPVCLGDHGYPYPGVPVPLGVGMGA